jgi:antitoxin MazE
MAPLCIFIAAKREFVMKTRLQKWGNSLAVHIPRSLAAEAGLQENASVELFVLEGSLVIRPVAEHQPTLDELLPGVTSQNLHGEWDTGPAVGREAW